MPQLIGSSLVASLNLSFLVIWEEAILISSFWISTESVKRIVAQLVRAFPRALDSSWSLSPIQIRDYTISAPISLTASEGTPRRCTTIIKQFVSSDAQSVTTKLWDHVRQLRNLDSKV